MREKKNNKPDHVAIKKTLLQGISENFNKQDFESLVLELGDALTEGFILLRPTPSNDFNIIYINIVCCQLFKTSPENIIGKPISDFFDHSSIKELQSRVQSGKPLKVPVKIKFTSIASGLNKWKQEFALVRLPSDLLLLRLIRSGDTASLYVNKKKGDINIEQLASSQSVGVFKSSLTGICLFGNPAFFDFFGLSEIELHHQNWLKHVFGENALKLEKALAELNTKAGAYCEEIRLLHKDGTISWVLCILNKDDNIPDSNEALIGFLVDISHNKNESKLLKESQERYRFFSDVTFEGIILHKKGIIVDVNASFTRITGYTRDDAIGENVLSYVPAKKDISVAREKIMQDYAIPYRISMNRKTGESIIIEIESRQLTDELSDIRVVTIRDVSERVKMEQALRESDSQYKAMVENNHDGIYIYRGDHFVFTNKRMHQFSGYSKEEMHQKKIWDLLHPDDRQIVLEIGRKRAQGLSVPSFYEARVICKNGEIKTCEFSVSTVLYNNAYAALGVVRDVSERKKYESRLQKSEKRFREMVENLPAGAILIENGRLYLNKHASEIIEYSNDEIQNPEQWFERLFGDEAKAIQIIFEKEKKAGFTQVLELSVRTRSGQIKQLEIAGRTYMDSMVWLIRDISEYLKAREEINLQADTLDKSLNSFFIIGPEGHFIYVNRAYLKNWGFSNTTELIGKSIEDHFPTPQVARGLISSIKKKGEITEEFTAKKSDGTLFDILLSAYLYKGTNGTELIAGSSIDITEQNNNLSELKTYKNHLEELVNERTLEIATKNEQLERMNNLFVGREFRIKELRDELKELREKVRKYEDE